MTATAATKLAERFPGWVIWTSAPVATRAAVGRPPRYDSVWSATLVCDDWTALERKLGEQAANDAARDRPH